MKKPIFIIEHLEPEVFEWCLIEYKHISKIVGKENLWFTNLKKIKGAEKLKKLGKCFNESVKTMNLQNICVLDPQADKILEPSEAKEFNYLIFGGILGDYPPKQRTKEELTKFIDYGEIRNIGKEQMSTDNAVYVVNEIVEGNKFENLEFQDIIQIRINSVESVELPYRYRLIKDKPVISKELVKYLKNKKEF